VNAALLFAANHLWQSTLFAAAAGLLVMALRRSAARARHWVWMIASVKFLVPFWLFTNIGSHLGWLKSAAAPAARISVAVEYFSQPFVCR
jgi:bla regulator protein BlaR1